MYLLIINNINKLNFHINVITHMVTSQYTTHTVFSIDNEL